jgi:transcriptional regulator with XRE-family HTH domain
MRAEVLSKEKMSNAGSRTLDRWIERSGFTAHALARELKISEGHLSHLRHGKKLPSLRDALAIEAACEIPVKAWYRR